jgi:hypothetical protein
VIYYNGGGNIPLPKFDPKLDTAENFLSELEVYMRRKRIPLEDWVLMLSPIFNHNPKQILWWRRTRMVVKSWSDFVNHFRGFFASRSEMHSSLENLLTRRQQTSASFETFAFEMDLMYRKVYNLHNEDNSKEILSFIAERSLPQLKPHLLACNATDIYELVQFGAKLEVPKNVFVAKDVPQSDKKIDEPFQSRERPGRTRNGPRKDMRNRDEPSSKQKKSGPCIHCQRTNHPSEECWFKKPKAKQARVKSPEPVPEPEAPSLLSNQGNKRK